MKDNSQYVWAKKPVGRRYLKASLDRGIILNETNRPCFEGCRGTRMSVRWPDGTITYPCSHGMRGRKDGSSQII